MDILRSNFPYLPIPANNNDIVLVQLESQETLKSLYLNLFIAGWVFTGICLLGGAINVVLGACLQWACQKGKSKLLRNELNKIFHCKIISAVVASLEWNWLFVVRKDNQNAQKRDGIEFQTAKLDCAKRVNLPCQKTLYKYTCHTKRLNHPIVASTWHRCLDPFAVGYYFPSCLCSCMPTPFPTFMHGPV